MFSFFEKFFPATSVLPSHQTQMTWLDDIDTKFLSALEDTDKLAQTLVDGQFVFSNNHLLQMDDFLTHSFEEVLNSCIDALNASEEKQILYPFRFRDCNIQRIIAFFNQLALPCEFTEHLEPFEQYKISLAICYVQRQSIYGLFYDELMVEADLEQSIEINQNKKEFEKMISQAIKSNFSIEVDLCTEAEDGNNSSWNLTP